MGPSTQWTKWRAILRNLAPSACRAAGDCRKPAPNGNRTPCCTQRRDGSSPVDLRAAWRQGRSAPTTERDVNGQRLKACCHAGSMLLCPVKGPGYVLSASIVGSGELCAGWDCGQDREGPLRVEGKLTGGKNRIKRTSQLPRGPARSVRRAGAPIAQVWIGQRGHGPGPADDQDGAGDGDAAA